MRKHRTIEIKVKKELLLEVFCDFCKKKIDNNFVDYEGFGQIKIEFSYPSNYDGDVYTGEICDDCFKKHFKNKLKLEYNIFGLVDKK